jgi:hypothetical protein
MRQRNVIKLKNNTPTNQVVLPIKEIISTQKLQKSSIVRRESSYFISILLFFSDDGVKK